MPLTEYVGAVDFIEYGNLASAKLTNLATAPLDIPQAEAIWRAVNCLSL